MRHIWRVTSAALLFAACSGSGESRDTAVSTSTASTNSTPAATDAPPPLSPTDTDVTPLPTRALDGPLDDVCPEVITIQLGALPGFASGPLFELLGNDVEVESNGAVTRATLTRPNGEAEGVVLELRSGGPPTGFVSALDVMRNDESIDLAVGSVSAAADEQHEVIAVMALAASTRLGLIWDPSTYPDIETVADLAQAGVEVRHVTGSRAIDFLLDNDLLSNGVTVQGFDGEPAAFVSAAGAIAQLGDLVTDPPLFLALPQWGREVGSVSLATVGWADIDDALFIRNTERAELGDCLARFVRLVQSSAVSYAADPVDTNAVIATVTAQIDPLSRFTPQLLNSSAQRAVDTGVFANGHDRVAGNFDVDELASFVTELGNVDPATSLDGLVTNEFIDPAIGF